ncbi:hypothetical protein HYV58_00670 [Candidatus Peregrinibacteria bacterium]|nr:hypothetical protein [Candidatus Peregrinibacteria bacterium]
MIKKKNAIMLGLAAVIAILIALSSSSNFLGRLVFFEDAPVRDQVIEGNFIKHGEALELLISAAQEAGRIGAEKAAAFKKEFQKSPDRKITRREFAEMAVKIFGIGEYGSGPQLSDVNGSLPSARAVYLFVSHGGISLDFNAEKHKKFQSHFPYHRHLLGNQPKQNFCGIRLR